MKISVVPDIHLNKTVFKGVMDKVISDLPFRNVDFMNAFEWVVDKNISDIKPDLFVIPGDIYDHPDPSNKVRRFFSKQLRKLNEADIPVIILIGNHDVSKREHGISDILELKLKKTLVIENPTINAYKGIRLLLFPYSLEVEQKKKTIKQDFLDFLNTIHAQKSELPTIFFGHFGVMGASMNQYTEEEVIEQTGELTDSTTTTIVKEVKEFVNKNPKDISLDDLDSIGAEYVILGDYHRHQILATKKCFAMYPGSLERTNSTEADMKKGFIVFDTEAEVDKKLGKCRFVEYPNCRPMMELEGNLTQIKDQFRKLDYPKYKGAIIKLKFHGTRDELIDFSSGVETLKQEIRDKVDPIHVYTQNDVIDEGQKKAATKLESEILKKGHLDAEDIIDCVKEMIVERVKDETDKKLTLDLCLEEYSEYKETKKVK